MTHPIKTHALTILFGLCAALMFGACTTEDLSGFEIEQQSKRVTVKGVPGNRPLPVNAIPSIPLTLDLQSELQAQNSDNAKAVFLRVLVLKITEKSMPEGDEDTFDFVKTIDIYVEPTDPDSALPKVKVADTQTVPKGVQSLTLDVDETVDLKPYIDEGLTFTTQTTGTLPPDDVSMRATVTVRVRIL